MINETNVKMYCGEDISLIENYWDAINDETQVWDCHHKNEFFRGISVSKELLIDIGLYYGCPADELIFLTHSEHARLHQRGKPKSEETRRKLSAAKKGKHLSDEHKRKLSEVMKEKTRNRLGVKLSEETRRKISAAKKGKPSNRLGAKLSEETRKKMSDARKAYWGNMRAKQ